MELKPMRKTRAFGHLSSQAPSSSKRYVLKLKAAFDEQYPSDSPSAKTGKFFYSKPESEEAREALELAVTDPDTHLEADLCASSPVIGPGISRERSHFDKLIAFARNGYEQGPPVETFLQQLFRDRTINNFTIYLKSDPGLRSLPFGPWSWPIGPSVTSILWSSRLSVLVFPPHVFQLSPRCCLATLAS